MRPEPDSNETQAQPKADTANARSRPRLLRWTPLALTFASTIGAVVFWQQATWVRNRSAEGYAYAPSAPGEPPRLWQLPKFALTDHRHAILSRDSLNGQPFVADFIFTQCTNACPMMTSRLVQVQRRLKGETLRFVSFSVDPVHDTAEKLAAYAHSWNPTEDRWSLVPTTPQQLSEIARAFRVAATPNDEPDNPILHSSVFLLVDAEGFVRGVYPSDDSTALDRLVQNASELAVNYNPTAPRTQPSYGSLGCGGCHDDTRIAPALFNLQGAERTLADGSQIRVDQVYLRQSVIEPARHIVNGYLSLMPSYRKELSDAELDGLIGELLQRRNSIPIVEVKVVTDPVCNMRVRTEPEAPHATHDGHEVYFCSEMCRDQYLAEPSRYPLRAE